MSYEKGEIYFVRERNGPEGLRSPFVKIGLVRYKDKRDSFNRLAEHQTGNPRTLELVRDEIVVTDAVDMVEAQLHRVFAKERVSGEWFEFPDDQKLGEAVAKAKALAAEVAPIVPKLTEAEKLKNVASNGKSKEASEDNRLSAQRLAVAKEQVAVCVRLIKTINTKIAAAVDAGQDISSIAATSVRKYSPKFLVEAFQAAHPDLYEKYLTEISEWEQRFLLKTKLEDDTSLGQDFSAIIREIEILLAPELDRNDIVKLNEPYLQLTHLKGLAEWAIQIETAELKLALGEFDELNGLCTWKRYSKVGMAFDSDLFAIENPELALKFVSVPEEKTYVQAKKKKL